MGARERARKMSFRELMEHLGGGEPGSLLSAINQRHPCSGAGSIRHSLCASMGQIRPHLLTIVLN